MYGTGIKLKVNKQDSRSMCEPSSKVIPNWRTCYYFQIYYNFLWQAHEDRFFCRLANPVCCVTKIIFSIFTEKKEQEGAFEKNTVTGQ